MKFYRVFVLLTIVAATACKQNVTFNVPPPPQLLVVEGHIDVNTPPYVILTRNSSYYGTTSINDIANSFVHGAVVKVWDDAQDTVTLNELTFDTAGVEVGVYTTLAGTFVGQPNHTYYLQIQAEGKTVTSQTSIPTSYPLDSIWVKENVEPNKPNLVQLMVKYTDPPDFGQAVRYFTRVNHGRFLPGINSIFNDQLINGTTIVFPLDRGVDRNDSTSYHEFGYFHKGDTITVQWANIDQAHYNFWRTMEFEINQKGPFSSPIKVQSNIVGGLGIWGGYNSSYKTTIAPQ